MWIICSSLPDFSTNLKSSKVSELGSHYRNIPAEFRIRMLGLGCYLVLLRREACEESNMSTADYVDASF